MAQDLRSYLDLLKAAIRAFKRQGGGRIINIGSMAGPWCVTLR